MIPYGMHEVTLNTIVLIKSQEVSISVISGLSASPARKAARTNAFLCFSGPLHPFSWKSKKSPQIITFLGRRAIRLTGGGARVQTSLSKVVVCKNIPSAPKS